MSCFTGARIILAGKLDGKAFEWSTNGSNFFAFIFYCKLSDCDFGLFYDVPM